MTVYKSYVVFDKVNEEYAYPFFVKNDIVARRQFDKFIDSCDPIVKGDYVLYCNGAWDNTSGSYELDWYEVTDNKVLDSADEKE